MVLEEGEEVARGVVERRVKNGGRDWIEFIGHHRMAESQGFCTAKAPAHTAATAARTRRRLRVMVNVPCWIIEDQKP